MAIQRQSAVGFCLSLIAIAAPGPSNAQSEIPQIDAPSLRLMLCSKVKDDAPRLKCFDEALAALQKPTKADDGGFGSSQRWEFNETKSPVDDSPQVAAGLLAENYTGSIVFRCRERRITGAFLPNGFINSGREGIRGLYRINSDKPIEARWSPSSDMSAAFFNDAAGLLRALPDDGKLFMRAYDFRGAPHDATFTVGKVSEVRTRVFAACAAAVAPKSAKSKAP